MSTTPRTAPTAPPMTYVQVAAVLQEIGMLSQEKAHSVLRECADCTSDTLNPYEVAEALEVFGVAVSLHTEDLDFLESDDESLLQDAAALTGGAVTVAHVRLHEEEDWDGEFPRWDRLEFERNGRLISLSAEHLSDDYYDIGAALECVEAVSPDDDPRSFRVVDFEGTRWRLHDTIVVLATPEQTEALGKSLGLAFEPLADPAGQEPENAFSI
ncbi:hypothetical protein [Streptomyces chattanoogensis]|nr:hypothetical protein [Streptomyces chattanoogensis]